MHAEERQESKVGFCQHMYPWGGLKCWDAYVGSWYSEYRKSPPAIKIFTYCCSEPELKTGFSYTVTQYPEETNAHNSVTFLYFVVVLMLWLGLLSYWNSWNSWQRAAGSPQSVRIQYFSVPTKEKLLHNGILPLYLILWLCWVLSDILSIDFLKDKDLCRSFPCAFLQLHVVKVL